MRKRITDEDIEGSISGDAYGYMDPQSMIMDESEIYCAYCKNCTDSLDKAYVHFRSQHKDKWDLKIENNTSKVRKGNKIIITKPDLENKTDSERHLVEQSQNPKVCIIWFDAKLEYISTEESILDDSEFEIDLGNRVTSSDIHKLSGVLKDWLKVAQKHKMIENGKPVEEDKMYSQNVGEKKLVEIINKLLVEDALIVHISKNTKGNFIVKYSPYSNSGKKA